MDIDNVVICGEAERVLPDVPDESVSLVFTSPPYGVGKEYESDFRIGSRIRVERKTLGSSPRGPISI